MMHCRLSPSVRSMTMAVAVACLLPITPLQADEPEELIKYRQNVMSVLGGHTSASVAIARGQIDQLDHLLIHARGLTATLPLLVDLFPPESAEGETDALPRIWEEPEAFNTAIERATAAADDFLAAVSEGGDVATAVRDLGLSCRGCHEDYRVRR